MATVRLWGPRTQLHEAYRNCLTRTGLRNDVIGRVEGWMDAPEARMSLPARRDAPLTAQAFQAEVARRMRTELLWALQTFLRAYSVANLESIATDDVLYGYFVMIAPGRVACASPPMPIAAGLCAMGATVPFPGPDPEVLLALLERNIAFDDRFLVQLMAMHRLLKQGEPELALIGCVTAIEWFLNDRLAASVQRMRGGKEMKASVTLCLRSGALNFLPERQREALLKLALRRNAIVHGPPPVRTGQRAGPARTATATSPDDVRSSLFLALELYRTVNLRSEAA